MVGWLAPGMWDCNHCSWQVQGDDEPWLPHLVLVAHNCLDQELWELQMLLRPCLCPLPGELVLLQQPWKRQGTGEGLPSWTWGSAGAEQQRPHPDNHGHTYCTATCAAAAHASPGAAGWVGVALALSH